MPTPPRRRPPPNTPRVGLARALSKLGICSRTEAVRWIQAGRVTVDARLTRDPERLVNPSRSRIQVDGVAARAVGKHYLAMNKPRGLITSNEDPDGRPTVYAILKKAGLPWMSPVGRLDQASEGLLLFSNDTRWSHAITDPDGQVPKTYHVQVAGLPSAADLVRMHKGVLDAGERLAAHEAQILRAGGTNCWLELVLIEGKNRHIRRMLEALGFETLRLIRVAIGPLLLGDLPKGAIRPLTPAERKALSAAAG